MKNKIKIHNQVRDGIITDMLIQIDNCKKDHVNEQVSEWVRDCVRDQVWSRVKDQVWPGVWGIVWNHFREKSSVVRSMGYSME